VYTNNTTRENFHEKSYKMTLPDERYRAVVQTQKFLLEILSTPRVPKAIKDRARSCLRHYPSDWDMQRAAEGAPDVFQEQMEAVTRLFKSYEEKKNEQA
jgi:hypothetical protein